MYARADAFLLDALEAFQQSGVLLWRKLSLGHDEKYVVLFLNMISEQTRIPMLLRDLALTASTHRAIMDLRHRLLEMHNPSICFCI